MCCDDERRDETRTRSENDILVRMYELPPDDTKV